jgi:hypothetical protein
MPPANPAASSSRMPPASGRMANPSASSSLLLPAAGLVAPSYTPPADPSASASRMPPATPRGPADSSGRVQPTGYVGNGRPAPSGTEPEQRIFDLGSYPAPAAPPAEAYSERGRRSAESAYVAPVAFGPGAGGPVDRRSVESGYMAPVARGNRHGTEEPGGGRRHRADGQPSWQDSQNGSRSGSHARPDADMPSGSHATGRSVSDLLASNGTGTNTPRRRRRRED